MAQRKKPPVGTAPPPAAPPAPPSEPERVPLADIAAFPGNPTLHLGVNVRQWYVAHALKATKGDTPQQHAEAAVALADAVLEILDPKGAPLQAPTVAPRQDGPPPAAVPGPPGK